MPSRRVFLKRSALCTAALSLQTEAGGSKRNGRIRQSVSRWCYKSIPLDQLCAAAAEIGLQGIDLLQPEEYEVPRRYGLLCAMGYAGGGEIDKGLNRLEIMPPLKQAFAETYRSRRRLACPTSSPSPVCGLACPMKKARATRSPACGAYGRLPRITT